MWQIIATSDEVTLNSGLVRESPQNALDSGLGFIVICPDLLHSSMFHKISQPFVSESTLPNHHQEIVEVPRAQIARVIGKRGRTIAEASGGSSEG